MKILLIQCFIVTAIAFLLTQCVIEEKRKIRKEYPPYLNPDYDYSNNNPSKKSAIDDFNENLNN